MTTKSATSPRDQLLIKLLARGYTCIPLAGGTKRPLVIWGEYREAPPKRETQLQWFAERPRADIGIITGQGSRITVLDFDAPPYIEGRYLETPSGGRHYYYPWHPDDFASIGVRPGLDIPAIIKVYGLPELNEGHAPVRANRPEQYSLPFGGMPAVPADRPDFQNLLACNFIRWFRERREDPDWDGRYSLARAYASSAIATRDPDLGLGPGYRHTDAILTSLGPAYGCQAIVKGGYQCQQFNPSTSMCRLRANVTSPVMLARREEST